MGVDDQPESVVMKTTHIMHSIGMFGDIIEPRDLSRAAATAPPQAPVPINMDLVIWCPIRPGQSPHCGVSGTPMRTLLHPDGTETQSGFGHQLGGIRLRAHIRRHEPFWEFVQQGSMIIT